MTFPVDRYLRAARRRADMSQRELATHAGVSQSALARLEHSPDTAKVALFAHVLATIGLQLVVTDDNGNVLEPESEADAERRDCGLRRFPAHLDVRPGIDGWWGAGWPMFEGKRPERTFDRNRDARDYRRAYGRGL